MALFTKTKEAPAGPTSDVAFSTTESNLPTGGHNSPECMQIGQLLVESGQLTPEALATTLQIANGDVLQFGETALSRFGAGRQEMALAVSQVFGFPAADTKGIELDADIVALFDEKLIRENQV